MRLAPVLFRLLVCSLFTVIFSLWLGSFGIELKLENSRTCQCVWYFDHRFIPESIEPHSSETPEPRASNMDDNGEYLDQEQLAAQEKN